MSFGLDSTCFRRTFLRGFFLLFGFSYTSIPPIIVRYHTMENIVNLDAKTPYIY